MGFVIALPIKIYVFTRIFMLLYVANYYFMYWYGCVILVLSLGGYMLLYHICYMKYGYIYDHIINI